MQNERRQALPSTAKQRNSYQPGGYSGCACRCQGPTFQLSRCRLYSLDSALLAQTHAVPSGIVFTAFLLSILSFALSFLSGSIESG